MEVSTPESPRKKTRRSKKQPPPPYQIPISDRETGDNAVMDLLLDMSSRMEAMEEFVAQHTLPHLTGNQGPIPERRHDHTQHDGAATSSSAHVAAGCLEGSGTITPKDAKGHIPEMVRRLWPDAPGRQAPLLVESFTDESEMDQKPDQRKKRQKGLKSGKVRTADSTVVKRITCPHELVYNSGGESVTYDPISMPQFVTGYLSVLDTVKT